MRPSDSPVLQWAGRPAPRSLPARLTGKTPGDPATLLVHGDNLAAMHALLPQYAGRVTLAYLDPPFFTNREFSLVARSRNEESGVIERTHAHAFDDRWGSIADYLEALVDRVHVVRQLLAPHGAMVLHVDPKTSHYAKILCDEVFGPAAFASEIVWRYRRWPAKTKNFQRVHDTLLRYVKDPEVEPRFHQLYEPLAASTQRTWGTTKQRAVVDSSGRRQRSSKTLEPTPGTPLGDVWEIGIVAPVARERTGYPTQKPEALLERLLSACTHEGDLVLDPYAGSGTTLAVARRLGRACIGIDAGREALRTTRERLTELGFRPTERRVTLDSSVRKVLPRRSRQVA